MQTALTALAMLGTQRNPRTPTAPPTALQQQRPRRADAGIVERRDVHREKKKNSSQRFFKRKITRRSLGYEQCLAALLMLGAHPTP